MAQLDPDVISFLKQRNAPLTNANYNSVLQQMQAHPELRPSRGADVAEPSYSDKTYDGGLDELDLGDDARVGHNTVKSKHGSDDARSAHAPNDATHEAGPAANAAREDTPRPQSKPTPPAQDDNNDYLAPALAAGGGAAAAGGAYFAANRGGGGAGARVEPSLDIPGGSGGTGLVTLQGAPATGGGGSSGFDLLSGHAPPAALSPPQVGMLTDPRAAAAMQLEGPAQAGPAQLAPPRGELEGFVTPNAAPRSAVVPMPDNAPQGIIPQMETRIKQLLTSPETMQEGKEMLMRLMQVLGYGAR